MDSTHWHRPIALPTLHGKHALIAPVLEAATGCTVLHVADIDTDRLGSFTRLVPRAGSQLQAARAGQATVRDAQQLRKKAAEWGFPKHQ